MSYGTMLRRALNLKAKSAGSRQTLLARVIVHATIHGGVPEQEQVTK
jgi:hypothetical protein